ncbi:STAS domain-containing protein [Nonomuraea sp. NPDC000554]|uniref:STAS domain-containing protein n=1 Tax=Nonomuraea sp. NPDC000554 TaxID=3154259 RepID=UPI0033209A9D
MAGLTCTCQHLPGVTVIAAGGDLDHTTVGQFDVFVSESRQQPGDHLVFDLAEVRFMDSAGLRALLNVHAFAGRHGGTVRLAVLQPMPARLVRVTRVEEHLPVHGTVDQALTAALSTVETPRPPS